MNQPCVASIFLGGCPNRNSPKIQYNVHTANESIRTTGPFQDRERSPSSRIWLTLWSTIKHHSQENHKVQLRSTASLPTTLHSECLSHHKIVLNRTHQNPGNLIKRTNESVYSIVTVQSSEMILRYSQQETKSWKRYEIRWAP